LENKKTLKTQKRDQNEKRKKRFLHLWNLRVYDIGKASFSK